MNIEASVAALNRHHPDNCIKIAEDLDRYRAVIAEFKPDLIVETGSFVGQSALWFAQFCPVISIDVQHRGHPHDERVTWLIGSSIDPAVVAEVQRRAAAYCNILVSLDSDHSAAHVLAEMRAYAPLADRMVVEDGVIRWCDHPYDGTPLDAIEEFLASNPQWTVDEAVQNMSEVTQNPSGWLRRRRMAKTA